MTSKSPFFAELLAGDTPRVMGILNITPDSFSDGGLYLDAQSALDRALLMESQGAAMIDVGAESTRPGAAAVSEEEELRRLMPVMGLLVRKLRIPISVDTYKFEVMRRMLDLGARVINDVRAMREDVRIPKLLAERQAPVILMHSRGTPDQMQKDTRYRDLVGEVIDDLQAACAAGMRAGMRPENIAVDPGIGFGKSAEGSWELLRGIPQISEALKRPILIGLSRKSFLTATFGLDQDKIGIPMAAAHLSALTGGARILRAHDIIEALQVIEVFERTRNR